MEEKAKSYLIEQFCEFSLWVGCQALNHYGMQNFIGSFLGKQLLNTVTHIQDERIGNRTCLFLNVFCGSDFINLQIILLI